MKLVDETQVETVLGMKNLTPKQRALIKAGEQVIIVALATAVASLMGAVLTGESLNTALLVSFLVTFLSALATGAKKLITANAEPTLADIFNRGIDYGVDLVKSHVTPLPEAPASNPGVPSDLETK